MNPSYFSCITKSDFGEYKCDLLDERHARVFGKFKDKNSVLFDFSGLIIGQIPVNMLNFLSDQDLEGFVVHLFDILNDRRKKKVYMKVDKLDNADFFSSEISA